LVNGIFFLLEGREIYRYFTATRLFDGDELGIQLETNSKSIKLPVPKGKDDVLVVKRKNFK
jgi:hypothetical protein